MSIEWTRDEFDMVGAEVRFGEYEFRAAVRPGRDEICGEVSGYAEVTASCWLAREKATLNIAHLLVFPHLGIAPTLAGDQRAIEATDEARQAQGHPPLPAPPGGTPPIFDRHGQGDLFSVPGRDHE